MVPDELLHILVSLLTAAVTTFLISYMKDKKIKRVEQIAEYDDRMGIIDSIALISFISFVLVLSIASLNVDFKYKVPLIILVAIGILFFTYAHLRFRKSFLIKTYGNKGTRKEFTLISLFILIIWIAALIVILGSQSNFVPFVLILLFYSTLFNLRIGFKWSLTRNYNKILVFTTDGDIYESTELINLDEYVVIYESKSDKRIVIPNHQIKLIEYEYKKTTVADFIDEEH